MKDFFKNFNKEKVIKYRKYFFLALAVLSMVLTAVLLFIPYCSYATHWVKDEITGLNVPRGIKKLFPIKMFSMLQDEVSRKVGAAYLGLGVFIAILLILAGAIFFFSKSLLAFLGDEKKLSKSVKRQLIYGTIVTGAYFLSSIIVCFVIQLIDGFAETVNNFYPLIFMLVLDTAHAVLVGLLKKWQIEEELDVEEKEEKKQKIRSEHAAIYKARAELFVFLLIIVILSVLALLTNIATITYEEIAGHTPEKIKLSGAKLLRDYLTLDEGGRIIAFIVMALLMLIGSVAFLSIIAFASRSDTFYKLSLGTIAVSVVAAFLVGMFGKYYQVVQKLNEGMLHSYIETLLEEGVLEYDVKSSSIYYFFGVIGVIAVLLVRNPYTRGVKLEREIKLREQSKNPQTVRGEISVTDVPNVLTKRNDGTIVSTDETTGEERVFFADPCPIFTELDKKFSQYQEELEAKRAALFEEPTLPKLVQFIVQYARDSRLHLSYTEEDIAVFIAGLGTTKLSILQGMSGTGKTSLPKIFAEALHARCEIVEVESSWRDKNELLGYYNEFSKSYTPKKFTQALYRAKLNPETLTFIVLDEMNLSRIEYYFSDFLSLMENEPDKRELRLLNVNIFRTENGEAVPYRGLFEGHTLKIPANVWFIGTANRDESTFEISDKVYDRAHTMNFNKRATKVLYYNDPIPQRFLSVDMLEELFAGAKQAFRFNIDAYPVIAEAEKLLAPYNISFGNRIAMQIESFVSIYCSCFAASESIIHTAVEKILLSKVVSKLELKSVDDKERLAAEFEKLNLRKCSEFILKLNED